MDVGDQPRPQVVQRLLAARAEAHDGRALGDAGDDQRRRRRSAASTATKPTRTLVVADDALVDRLLQQDRHDHPAAGADGGEQPRDAAGPGAGPAPPAGPRPIVWTAENRPIGSVTGAAPDGRRSASTASSARSVSNASTSAR